MFFIAFRFVPYENGDENIYLGGQEDLLLGDINQDEIIDVLDIVIIVQFVLNFSTPSDLEFELSDINQDGTLDILDIVSLIDIILN